MQGDVIFRKGEHSLTAELVSEIDHHTVRRMREKIDAELFLQRPELLILDFSGVGFMDSSGLGLIMGRYALMQRLGGELTLKNPNERVVKIFELAGLGRIIKIENEESEIS